MDQTIRLLDFLYADHERVASLLAQINGSGALTGTEEMAGTKKTGRTKGDVKLGIASVGGDSGRDWQKEVRRTFDPLWTNSGKLIEHFQGQEAPSRLQVGQTVILEGRLLAYDLSLLSSMMKTSAVEHLIAAGIDDDPELSNRSSKHKSNAKDKKATVIRELLNSFGLGFGFVLVSEVGHFWFSVKKEYLSLYDLDIPLKFPAHISGTWQALGVVDALPNDHVEGLQDVIDMNIDGLLPPAVFNMMELIGTMAGMFGRPITAYGLSPLVVFREISTT